MRLLLQISIVGAISIENENVLIDMTQNNPGDAVAWEQSKYFDARVLKQAGYTAQSSTGETSGTQAVDFHSTGIDFFPAKSAQRLWLDAYTAGVKQQVDAAKASGIKAYFFVDLLVFPTFVIDHYKKEITQNGKLVWNNATANLTQVLIDETFAKFPGCDGFIIRTGETYTYDTPYHKGNSPCPDSHSDCLALWVDFINNLRTGVCEKHGKDVFIRTWDNWPSTSSYYLSLSNQIQPHSHLYFSIKYTAGDFLRNQRFNAQLGVGKHAQIVEVELQREYEGKGAHPNYVMDIAINGPTAYEQTGIGRVTNAAAPKCLSDLVGLPQLKGLWTWTRGGGWWGPYIHGNEMHIDLHFQVISSWWKANFPSSPRPAPAPPAPGPPRAMAAGTVAAPAAMTEAEAFAKACANILSGCTAANGCCAAFRTLVRAAAHGVYLGKYGGSQNTNNMWLRDDRIGTMETAGIGSHSQSSMQSRVDAMAQWALVNHTYVTGVRPHMTDPQQQAELGAGVEYGQRLYGIIEAGWSSMVLGYAKIHGLPFDATALNTSLEAYDARWAGYRAFGLTNRYAASLYHDYYLCLGTECSGAFSPLPGAAAPSGIGSSISKIRAAKPGPAPAPTPPAPTPPQQKCEAIKGFACKQGVYCSGGSTTFTNWSYSGADNITGCAAKCVGQCTCFIHSDAADPPLFPACRVLSEAVQGYYPTARGYSAWTKALHAVPPVSSQ
jgi:hypothetical protein